MRFDTRRGIKSTSYWPDRKTSKFKINGRYESWDYQDYILTIWADVERCLFPISQPILNWSEICHVAPH